MEIKHDKAEVLKDIEYNTHTSVCLETLNKWKKDSSNKEIRLFIKSFLETIFYTNTLQRDRFIHNKMIEEFRSDKLRAIERAQKAEAKTENLQKEISKLRKLLKEVCKEHSEDCPLFKLIIEGKASYKWLKE